MNSVVGYGRPLLSVEELLESALTWRRRDFVDRSFVHALERLIESCNEEADLSIFGVRALKVDLLRCLRNLLQFEEIEAAAPEVLTRPIDAPVFMTGMPRSGTTFLHRLILQDPAMAAPSLFQLVYPTASQDSAGTALRKMWVSVQLGLFRMIAPELNALHPIAVDAPEECTDITAQVFQSLRFDALYRVPSYNAWLQRFGFLDAYRFHRRFLQHLDVQVPGRRWLLKSPDHVFALDDLKRVYPDARLVFLHRDPVRVLASVVKLTETLRRPFARRVDKYEIGREVAAIWLDGAERMSRLVADGDGEQVLHLHYGQLIAAPLETVREVYEHCGLELTATAEARMRAWLGSRVNTERPQRSYSLAEFGLDPCVLRELFARYTNTFHVTIERDPGEAGARARS
jgi:hypothetical protein